jgi:membrane-associated phospholipid phosphatase
LRKHRVEIEIPDAMATKLVEEKTTGLLPSRAERWGIFVALGLLLTVPYFRIQHHVLFPARVVPLTQLDRLVPLFQPAVYVYLSLDLLLTLPLLLARDSRNLRQMAFGFALVTCVSHLFFFLWPTAIPWLVSGPDVTNPLLRMVVAVDTRLNACPSLHASLAIYCALCSSRLLKSSKRQAGVWLWTFLILASTLLTKRHVVLDLIAGGALGVAVYTALFRGQPSEAASSEAMQATLPAREPTS